MKLKYFSFVLSFLVILNCSQMEIIKKATLHNPYNGTVIELSDDKLSKLNELIQNGLVLTEGKNWAKWKYINADYDSGKKETISLFQNGHIKFNNNYYIVKESFKPIFQEIASSGE